jgi:hypothetical protein
MINSGPSGKSQRLRDNSDAPPEESGDSSSPNEPEKPPPLRSLLTKPIVVTVINHAMLALLNVVAVTYTPLVWSTPVVFGGLNLSPASIGLWLSVYGGMNGIFHSTFLPHLIRRFGLRGVFISSIVACAAIFVIFPFENLALRVVATSGSSSNAALWLLVILQLSSICVSEMGYRTPFAAHPLSRTRVILTMLPAAMYLYISSAAPNKRSLGAVNGLSQVATSIQSTVGPAAADWLFAFSLTHNVLGGNFAYVVLVDVACVALGISKQLPRKTWVHHKE